MIKKNLDQLTKIGETENSLQWMIHAFNWTKFALWPSAL
jgi:hypothetical protein